MGSDLFFNDERHFLLNNDGNLHLDWLNFGFMDLYSLIFYSISVGFNGNLFDDFIGDSFFDLYFNRFLFVDLDFNYFLDFNKLDLFLANNDRFFDNYLHGHFNILDDDLRNGYLDNL